MEVEICHVGVATVLFTVDGTTFINDPCFNDGGGYYHHGLGAVSRKTSDPRLQPDELPREPDVALVTHGHHQDNLDDAGRAFLENVPRVITTKYSAKSLDRAVGLDPGEEISLPELDSDPTLHAVPAQHGLFPLSKLAGPVNGYVLEFESTNTLVYVSGDTVYTDRIASRVRNFGEVDLFFPHLGNACFPYMSGPLRYTMNAEGLSSFLKELQPDYTYPIHNEGWSHFRPVDLSEVPALKTLTETLTEPELELELSSDDD